MFQFNPCTDGNGMTWSYGTQSKALQQYGLCAELQDDAESIQMVNCTGSTQQQWSVLNVSGGVQIQSVAQNTKCITNKKVGGAVVGLDPGTDVQAGLAEDCGQATDGQIQTFQLSPSAGQSFPQGFHFATSQGDCMVPIGSDEITFDAVAFETPTGDVNIIAMNLGEADITFDIYDKASQSAAKSIKVPQHGIASYTLPAQSEDIKIVI